MAMMGPAGGGQARSVLEGLSELQGDPRKREKLLKDTEAYETARAAAAAAQEALAGAQAGVQAGQEANERLRVHLAGEKAKLTEEWLKLKRSQDTLDGVRKTVRQAKDDADAALVQARAAHDTAQRVAAAAERDQTVAREAREAAEALWNRWSRILSRFQVLAAEAGGEGR